MKPLCKLAQWSLVGLTAIFILATLGEILPLLCFVGAIAVMLPLIESRFTGKLAFLKQGFFKLLVWLMLIVIGFNLVTTAEEKIARLESRRDVPALIAIVQEQDEDESPYAAKALGNLGDPQAVDPLISALETATEPELRRSAAEALGQLQDSRAVAPLIERLEDSDRTVVEGVQGALAQLATQDPKVVEQLLPAFREGDATVMDTLATIGKPSLDSMLKALQESDITIRGNAVEVLGGIGDPAAIEPLRTYLTDWQMGPQVGAALQQLNWSPASDLDKVHLWVALRNGEQLRANWEMTKQVLLNDVSSGEASRIEYGLYSFIGIGDQDVLTTLVQLLKDKGNETMAVAYLNCGEATLEKAAEDWAVANGYEVIQTQETVQTVQWGDW